YLVRFICAPKKWKFFSAPLNVVDLLAILPYFVGFIVEGIKDTLVIGRAGKVLRLIRVMRILRVFKLVRHFAGLQSLLSTLQQAYKELGLLMILVWVSVLTVSSLIYFAEKDAKAKWSFLDSFWWGLMVLTTVGSGSLAPTTAAGKLIGGFCALLGVFILALPVPIVVNRFTDFSNNYKNRLWRNEVMMKRQDQKEKVSEDMKCNGSLDRKV
ncbi:potassium voltage-gated channel subfamily B member 1, partial [Eurytemora carolleeae]|uniref:potassium voltage-gated channel subfamily B member 1 n=1 Tax=Eurytemora carolleeae TaxID=1294199 RepID=UPI000C75E998